MTDQSLAGLENHVVASRAFHDGFGGKMSIGGDTTVVLCLVFDELSNMDPLLEKIEFDVSGCGHRYEVGGYAASL